MAKNPDRKTLTELEGAALAFITRRGPCTSYAVKEAFRTSPSEFWSGSAGAVYPLMKRLEARKLVESRADESDGRARREFSTTRAGREALRAWLTDSTRAAGLGFDPLRTRLFFSDLMPDAARRRFIEETREKMEAADPAPPAADLEYGEMLHQTWTGLRIKALKSFAAALKK
ncbi:PadR family transcriptional regulator [Hyphococcus sp.]|uniref:PadR family transcriptional regulator n=1 Tax=Hyphococcus sp. TaxID=2038636 RepID=UPI003CCC3417